MKLGLPLKHSFHLPFVPKSKEISANYLDIHLHTKGEVINTIYIEFTQNKNWRYNQETTFFYSSTWKWFRLKRVNSWNLDLYRIHPQFLRNDRQGREKDKYTTEFSLKWDKMKTCLHVCLDIVIQYSSITILNYFRFLCQYSFMYL